MSRTWGQSSTSAKERGLLDTHIDLVVPADHVNAALVDDLILKEKKWGETFTSHIASYSVLSLSLSHYQVNCSACMLHACGVNVFTLLSAVLAL